MLQYIQIGGELFMNHKIIIALSSLIAVTLTGCETGQTCKECPEIPPVHEHTFASEWEHDESKHWHKATCEHTDLTKDLADHVFVNGVCECGYEEPIPEPTPEVTYFLPETIKHTQNDVVQELNTYTYDEDLHGYTEISTSEDPTFSSISWISKVRYNEDFSEMRFEKTCVYEEFNSDLQKTETHSRIESIELYEYFENGSYTIEEYQYDEIIGELVFDGKNGYFYNEYGQETVHYQLRPGDNLEDLEIFIYTEKTYDEKHRIIRCDSYEGTFQNKYLVNYDIYEYDDDENTGLGTSYSINSETQLAEIDYYTDIRMSEENGNSYFYEQICYLDGELGNYNVFGYDALLRPIYLNYNNYMISSLEENELNQITRYTYENYEGWKIDMNCSYNEDNLLSSTTKNEQFSSDSKARAFTSYKYSDTKQITNAASSYSYLSETEFSVLLEQCEVSYTSIESKDLLERIDINTELYRLYSDSVFRDWIY